MFIVESYPLAVALCSITFANAAGALSVMKQGAQPSAPKRAAIDRFLAGHRA